jgi:hypothetical protein
MPLLDQLLVNSFGLSTSGYTGSQGTTGYSGSSGTNGNNGYTGSAGPAGTSSTSPKITAIAYTGNDTAAVPAGGDTITLTGSNFISGATVFIDTVQASVVSVVNSTTITFTAPALATGSYIVYVINPDSSIGLLATGIQYSGTPTWTTAAGSLGNPGKQTSFTANLTATGDAPITYSVYSGSLPSGLTLTANTGVISGTTPDVASDTTYNFTIRATDAQQQDTDRSFSLLVRAITSTPTIDYLVVAGGGGAVGEYGGSAVPGGGGGGGGAVYQTGYTITPGTAYTITVGAGGTKTVFSNPNNAVGGNGVDSSINALVIAKGGGGGGSYQIGNNGGSGGGGGYSASSGGTSTQASSGTKPAGATAYGNNGGTGATISQGGAGGGGASTAGGSPNSVNGATGGSGFTTSISGTSTEYAGGGGGGCSYSGGGNGGSGLGGGGNGGTSTTNATDGAVNTGGGGGSAPNTRVGGAGGSGIVVIRYADTYQAAASTTGSPTITVAGGYRVYKFTTSGSITF